MDVQFVAIGRLMSGDSEEDSHRNRQADSLCLRKEPFAVLNEKAEPRSFKQL